MKSHCTSVLSLFNLFWYKCFSGLYVKHYTKYECKESFKAMWSLQHRMHFPSVWQVVVKKTHLKLDHEFDSDNRLDSGNLNLA